MPTLHLQPRRNEPTHATADACVPLRPIFYSDWLRALFIHYEVEPSALRPQVPYELDLYQGRAYVSLVAFTMDRLRPALGGRLAAWAVAPIAAHPFLNVRTYVRHTREPGIFFMSEWLPNRLSVLLGPRTFGLPYRFGRVEYHHVHESGLLSGSVIAAEVQGHVVYRARVAADARWGRCAAGSLDEFLVERYTAFTAHASVLRRFRIRHPPWPQAQVDVEFLDAPLLAATGPWHRAARLCHANYSPGVLAVEIGYPHRLRAPVLTSLMEPPGK